MVTISEAALPSTAKLSRMSRIFWVALLLNDLHENPMIKPRTTTMTAIPIVRSRAGMRCFTTSLGLAMCVACGVVFRSYAADSDMRQMQAAGLLDTSQSGSYSDRSLYPSRLPLSLSGGPHCDAKIEGEGRASVDIPAPAKHEEGDA